MKKDLPRLQKKYIEEVIPQLKAEMPNANVMEIPTITKIVVNSGLGSANKDRSIIDEMVDEMAKFTGQRPVVTKAKKAISNFKIRENLEIGVCVTLRRDMMWYFLDRLISIVIPRIKDFRGISARAFDKNGNYSLGIKEHSTFPEVDTTRPTKSKGVQIVICTSARSDERALSLLKKLGMPFKKN